MTTSNTARSGAHRIRTLLFAFVGVPFLLLLGFCWLDIPDSHVWQLGFSFISGATLAAAFLWVVSAAVLALRNPVTRCSHWLGAILSAFWMLIYLLLIGMISHVDDHAMERAGFWNSRLSAGMRVTFTFDRLIAWQHDIVLTLVWIVIPALFLPFLIETVSRGLGGDVWRVGARALRRWQHWLAVIVCSVAVFWLTGKLTGWRPSHSVHGELISLAFRLFLCYVANFVLIALLLSIESRLLAREHARRYPAAEPATNAV